MGDLTEHFSRHELACRCGCGLDEPSWPLLNALECLRELLGAPVVIVSGLRCEKHNRAVGGAAASQHLLGNAADIRVPGVPLSALFLRAAGIMEFHRGGIGLYPDAGFVHVDVRDTGRQRWGEISGVRVRLVDAWDHAKRLEAGA